jgi:hypothetical protein
LSTSEVIVLIRDIAFLSVLVLGAILALILYRRGSNLLNSGKRIAKHAEDISSTLSTRFVEPASGLGSALSRGKAGSLLLWPTRSWLRLGLAALAGVSALAWAKNWLGLRDRSSAGGTSTGEGEGQRATDGNNSAG